MNTIEVDKPQISKRKKTRNEGNRKLIGQFDRQQLPTAIDQQSLSLEFGH